MANGKKGASHASKAFSPSDEHRLTVGQATQAVLAGGTITVYGKIVKDIALSPSEVGTNHPRGKDGDLQLALVYGMQDQGQCITLPQPQKVYLPFPDGPADGCGWDPSQFLVWKNLPKNWQTVHVQSQSKPLAAALRTRAFALPPHDVGSTPFLDDVLRNDWLLSSQPTTINPGDQLSFLWTFGPGGEFNLAVQQKLAAVLKQAFGVNLKPTDLPGTLTFAGLQQLVGAS